MTSNESKRLDKRIVRSRKAILNAFEKLLLEKPLSDITVSAIAREASVDRKTFYVHFGTVDGLLDAIAEETVAGIADTVEESLGGRSLRNDSDSQEAARAFFATVNKAVCENLVLNRKLVENIPLAEFVSRVRRPLERQLHERELIPEELVDEMFDYYMSFLLSGIIGVYRTWALSDGEVPIEKVSGVANELMMHGLSSLKDRFPVQER